MTWIVGQHTMATSRHYLTASTTMNPELPVTSIPNLISSHFITAEALQGLQIMARITLWRRKAWSPLSHLCLMLSPPTITRQDTLQLIYPAPVQCRGVFTDSVHAALQQICPISIIDIVNTIITTHHTHTRSLRTTVSHATPLILSCNPKILKMPTMDMWPLLEM